MNLQITKPEAGCPLQIAGALDIYSADALRAALLQAVQEQPDVTLDLGAAVSCDIVALQLFYAVRRSAAALGKSFSITAVSAAVTEAAADLGLSESLITVSQSV